MAEQKREFQLEPHDLLLSVATVPLLAGLIVGRAVSELMMGLSQASEEVFRGDRLPILRFTQSSEVEER
ncbi:MULTISPECIES: hypothetical protein [unclassified Leptolyngbya]|uniref:hypothetical protein n=1 Tax=unclassified Leptolyngbya TaxID=2650499 RepID=UPI0016886586|nr:MULTISPECIES: hypothetical protein [unclassified Leptolyngbya]MBD1910466.1 hypothetical protein [Leptolyngbya sp. FACHB-8]MBD2153633.1 hypothetical protein [Leptolyngbya sp. FACHB-16]